MRRETIHAWLLLLPALVLLVAFTHWPAIATLVDSFYATPRGSRPAPFVGLDNYAGLVGRPGVLAGAAQQRLVRRGHHSGLDRAGVGDGAGGQRGPARPGMLRMAYFRRPCCR